MTWQTEGGERERVSHVRVLFLSYLHCRPRDQVRIPILSAQGTKGKLSKFRHSRDKVDLVHPKEEARIRGTISNLEEKMSRTSNSKSWLSEDVQYDFLNEAILGFF